MCAERLAAQHDLDLHLIDEIQRRKGPLPPGPWNPGLPPPPASRVAQGYRLKVTLQWMPEVWRVIEILDHHSLDDLHYAIQRAFGWDDDHLYAFFLSGRAWDILTKVERPYFDAEPPTADQVTLADLELQRKQRFVYLFDFGDDLRHDVEVLDIFSAPAEGEFPRIAETHGQAPPQYPSWEEDDEEWEDQDDGDEEDEAAR